MGYNLCMKNDLLEKNVREQKIDPILNSLDNFKVEREFYLSNEYNKNILDSNRKFIDYLIFKNNTPVMVLEAKRSSKDLLTTTNEQARIYAKKVGVEVYATTNGDDMFYTNTKNGIEGYYKISDLPKLLEDWSSEKWKWDFSNKRFSSNRYYQVAASKIVLENIANGVQNQLLVLATGTGKTNISLLIARNFIRVLNGKRILFISDRNELLEGPMATDFSEFKDISTKIRGKTIDGAHQIYFSTYHQFFNYDNLEESLCLTLDENTFDLIIVDEAHRSSADESSSFRDILNKFNAKKVAMTATPVDVDGKSSFKDYGDPVYQYDLADAIDEGYLAPFVIEKKILQQDIDGTFIQRDNIVFGMAEKDFYSRNEYNIKLFLEKRADIVINEILEFQKVNDIVNKKTIIFCSSEDHAGIVRDKLRRIYNDDEAAVRITSSDIDGKLRLDDFKSLDSVKPYFATTVELLSTGVDTKDVRLIVIDRAISSKVLYSQIIGRGTRLPKTDKTKFFVLDFRNDPRDLIDPKARKAAKLTFEQTNQIGTDGKVISDQSVSNVIRSEKLIPYKGGYVSPDNAFVVFRDDSNFNFAFISNYELLTKQWDKIKAAHDLVNGYYQQTDELEFLRKVKDNSYFLRKKEDKVKNFETNDNFVKELISIYAKEGIFGIALVNAIKNSSLRSHLSPKEIMDFYDEDETKRFIESL